MRSFNNPSLRDFCFLLVSLLISLVVFFWNSNIVGPMIQPDESSHLLNASAIVGYSNDFVSSYHAGYSMLIAPAFYFANTPEEAWLYVRVINTFLYFIGVFSLYLLAKNIYRGSSCILVPFSVIVVALYPMWVIMAGYSFSQIGFFAVYSSLACLVHLALTKHSFFWLLTAIFSAFLYWIHPTGAAVCIALSIIAFCDFFLKKKLLTFFVFFCILLLFVLIYQMIFIPWLHERMLISGLAPSFHYPSLGNALKNLFSLSGFLEFASRVSGHFFYLSIGTVGLIWGVLLYYPFKSFNKNFCIPSLLVFFFLLSVFGVVFLSALLFTSASEATRLDHWMYGRYVEGVIAPLMMLGVMTLSMRGQFLAILIIFVTALFLYLGMEDYSTAARMNISAFWQDFFFKDGGILIWAVSGACLVLISIALMKLKREAALPFFALVFIFMSSLQIDWHVRASSAASARSQLATIIRENYQSDGCIGFDHKQIDSYSKYVYWFDFGFYLYDFPLQKMTSADWYKDCDGPLFSYDKKLDSKYNVFLINQSSAVGPFLWAKQPLDFKGSYPFSINDKSAGLKEMLLEGWYEMESHHVWSSGEAILRLPNSSLCDDNSCYVTLFFSVFAASSSHPIEVLFSSSYGEVDFINELSVADTGTQRITVPLASVEGFQELLIHVPNATTPFSFNGSTDKRVLGIALNKIELQVGN